MSGIRRITSSFRIRLALGYALTILVVAAVWAWSLYGPLTTATFEQQRSHLVAIAHVTGVALDTTEQDPSTVTRRLASRSAFRITVVDQNGTVLADTDEDPARMENHADRPEIAAALRGDTGFDTRRSVTLDVDQMYVAVPATSNGKPLVVRVSEPLARVQDIAETGRNTGLLLLLAALGAALAVGLRLSASAAEPVLRLRDAAESMAAGDLRTPIPDADGDVGELSEALKALRDGMRDTIGQLESGQATLRSVLDGLQDAVYVFSGDRVELANRSAGILFGGPADERNAVALDATGLPASVAGAVRERLGCRGLCSIELGPDPESRYHRVTAMPLEPTTAGAARTLVVISDVTGVRSLDAVRRDFVANASHELKTPASAIRLLADAARVAADDGDTSALLSFVDSMRGEAERLSHLVSDLLDLSRLETPTDLAGITDVRTSVENAVAGHRAAAAAARLDLETDTESVAGVDVYAAADPTDVAIILDNLLANAIAYTEKGRVSVHLGADDSKVFIGVSDTGIGIAPEHLPRVFERFYRVDAARTRDTGGTGLGLSLVRNAVERWGGTIDVSSTVDKGTTVTVSLPRAR